VDRILNVITTRTLMRMHHHLQGMIAVQCLDLDLDQVDQEDQELGTIKDHNLLTITQMTAGYLRQVLLSVTLQRIKGVMEVAVHPPVQIVDKDYTPTRCRTVIKREASEVTLAWNMTEETSVHRNTTVLPFLGLDRSKG